MAQAGLRELALRDLHGGAVAREVLVKTSKRNKEVFLAKTAGAREKRACGMCVACAFLPLLLASAVSADYLLTFQTDVPVSDGSVVINVTEAWAPLGAAHLKAVVADNFFSGAAFFRVVPNFVVQFGISGTPAENTKWSTPIKDDPVASSNLAGTITYATAGPNTRTTQLFINLVDNARLDPQGFAPFGRVIQGMDVMRAVYNPTPGDAGGVDQGNYSTKGDAWIRKQYPGINFITSANVTSAL